MGLIEKLGYREIPCTPLDEADSIGQWLHDPENGVTYDPETKEVHLTLERYRQVMEEIEEEEKRKTLLAKQAEKEILETGTTKIRCPRCQTPPEITMTPKGERTIVSCECGYIHDVDINF